ncbi:hypothetical protein [Kitasatospora indigofera]|uniref:hypothetical protein n=1 Tax=Kitasatospora indigofera TaxID=67307 RepID=UPI0036A847BF
MSEIEIPEDLRALQQARADARLAVDLYDRQSTIARREAAAAAGAGAVLPWPQDVLDRMEELREDYRRAVAAISEHPIMCQARQDGTYNAVDHQLRLLVPTPVVAIVRDAKAGRDVVEVSIGGVVVERDGQPVQPA